MKKTFYLLLLTVLLPFLGCQKQPVYPDKPIIDFQKLIVKDTIENTELGNKVVLYQLYFKVLDGDNNIGLYPQDTTGIYSDSSVYHNNLFITLLNKKNGRFDTVHLPVPLYYRIPVVKTVSLYKFFKATIIVDIHFDPFVLQQYLDTFKFSFYLIDRNFNKSNIQQTPPIPVSFRGVIIDTVQIIH